MPETRDDLYFSRRARLELNLNVEADEGAASTWDKDKTRGNYLVPGKDNYAANLTDLFPDGTRWRCRLYSRFYWFAEDDAMGSSAHRRGFSARYLFAAKTTRRSRPWPSTTRSRWSDAIPLEVVFLTSLSRWNPHNISNTDFHRRDTGTAAHDGDNKFVLNKRRKSEKVKQQARSKKPKLMYSAAAEEAWPNKDFTPKASKQKRTEVSALLFAGTAGTGKSTLAHIVANHCGYPPLKSTRGTTATARSCAT